MSSELEIRGNTQIAPKVGFDEMKNMAEVMAKSKILGNWDTPEKILTVMLISQAEDCNPMQSIFRYDPIPCKAGVMARKKPIAMLADFQKRGGKLKWLVTTAQEAKGEFSMKDRDTFVFGYTWQQAVRAGLANKDNWAKNPDDMLRWQVVGRGLRIFDPASTGLMYTPYEIVEELEENGADGKVADATKPEGEKPQELFGTAKKSAGRPKKEEKVIEATVVEEKKEVVTSAVKTEPVTTIVPTAEPTVTTPTPVQEAMADATIKDATMKKSEPVVELSEYMKLIKTLPEEKVRGVLYGLLYLKPGEALDKVTDVRQKGIVKQWTGFKKKVENYQAFGTEA